MCGRSIRLARTLALQAGVQHWNRKTDEVTYAPPAVPIPGIDASLLAERVGANATMLSVGVTYANPGRLRPGGTGLPVDASWSYERVLRSGRGRVPDTHRGSGEAPGVLRIVVSQGLSAALGASCRGLRNSACACRRAASPSVSPSMRAISLTRSSP